MEPYTLDHGRRPATVVKFTLTGDDLEPERITEALGIPASKSWFKGEPNLMPSGLAFGYHRTSGWQLFPACSRYEDFEVQLDYLLNQLERLPPIFRELVEQFEGGIHIGFSSGEDNFGFLVDYPVIERLYKLGLWIDFDIYAINEKDGNGGDDTL